jgi:putative transposase
MDRAPQELRTYFTTFSTFGRRRIFQVDANAELMMDTLEVYRAERRFALHAFVVMPDHVHALITPAPEVSLEKAIQFLKGGFSFRLKSRGEVWERGHFDKRVPDRAAYDAASHISTEIRKRRICRKMPPRTSFHRQ